MLLVVGDYACLLACWVYFAGFDDPASFCVVFWFIVLAICVLVVAGYGCLVCFVSVIDGGFPVS